MSEASRHMLYLVVDGLPEAQRPKVVPGEPAEIFVLTEANAAEALEKIFAAEAVSVWADVQS